MKNYTLNIADYKIRIESGESDLELVPAARFQNFFVPQAAMGEANNLDETHHYPQGGSNNLEITVYKEKIRLPEKAICVFKAPYVEEINGMRIRKSDEFWSIWKHDGDLFIKTIFPLSENDRTALLKLRPDSQHWELYIESQFKLTDPLEYPLDALILYYLTMINRAIMIHASGIQFKAKGFLFSGISGKGKSTIAGLWDQHGAKVIHDDRLIVRRNGDIFTMYNTPVYGNDEPRESALNKIFILEHGNGNKLVRVKGAAAVSLVMANCIQHNWSYETIERLLGSVSALCRKIPVYRLSFSPDRSVIDHITENE